MVGHEIERVDVEVGEEKCSFLSSLLKLSQRGREIVVVAEEILVIVFSQQQLVKTKPKVEILSVIVVFLRDSLHEGRHPLREGRLCLGCTRALRTATRSRPETVALAGALGTGG